jgi:enolase
MEAIRKAGYEGKCTVGLDVAASEFKVKDTPNGEVRQRRLFPK